MDAPFGDPYRACEDGRCNHDLARAVAISDLWDSDGPFSSGHLVVNPGIRRRVLFDDDEVPAIQQRWAV